MPIDLQKYLQNVNSIIGGNTSYYVDSNNGYTSDNAVKIQQPSSSSNLPNSVYKKNGDVDYQKLEKFYKSRNNVSEYMTAWNPVDGWVHEISGNSDTYQWEHPILKAEPFGNALDKIQTSSSIMTANEIDNLLYHTLTPEYQDKFAEMIAGVKGQTLQEKIANMYQHGSGIITSADHQDLNTAALNATMITKTVKANVLAGFFNTTTTNELIVPFDEFEGPTVQEDLGEIEIPRTVQGRYTGFNIGLKKDGWHMAWTRMFEGIARRRNVIADNLAALRGDFDRVINERIASVLASITSVAGSSWSSFASATDLRNQNNPLAIINTVRQTLKNNGFPAEFSLSNLRVFQDYDNNTNVKGPLNTVATLQGAEGSVTLPKYGWRHGIDDTLADSTFWVLNSNVAERLQGAVINITYVENKSQVFGAIGYNHNNFAIKKAEAGRRIINIT